MVKKGSLTKALDKRTEATTPPPAPEPEPQDEKPKIPATRRGRKMLAGYVTVEASKQMKILSAEEGRTVQDLLIEAVNDLFTKYGKNPIA